MSVSVRVCLSLNSLFPVGILKDEMMKLRSAIDASREYTSPERHDPLYLMFDNDYLLGECVCLCVSVCACAR